MTINYANIIQQYMYNVLVMVLDKWHSLHMVISFDLIILLVLFTVRLHSMCKCMRLVYYSTCIQSYYFIGIKPISYASYVIHNNILVS